MNRLSSMSLKLTIHITNQITILLAVSIQNWGSSSQDKTLCCALRMDLSCLTRSPRFRQLKSKLFHWTPFPLTGKKGNCPRLIPYVLGSIPAQLQVSQVQQEEFQVQWPPWARLLIYFSLLNKEWKEGALASYELILLQFPVCKKVPLAATA